MSRRPLTVPYEPDRRDHEGPWAIALAMDVVEYDFGIFVRVVAECLTALGKPDIPQIAQWLAKRYPAESPALLSKKAKCALIVMLTHGCASASIVKKGTANGKAFTQTSGRNQQRFLAETAIVGAQTSIGGGASAAGLDGSGGGGVGGILESGNADLDDYGNYNSHYSFEVYRTLQRLRHPHFLVACRRVFKEPGAAIAQALLQNGPSRKGAALREAAHILARNQLDLAGRLPHHMTLPDYEGGPGSGRSGHDHHHHNASASASASAGGDGYSAGSGSAGAGADGTSSATSQAAAARRRRARSNSSASSAASSASSGLSRESTGGDANDIDINASSSASGEDRPLTKEEFERALGAVTATWQRMLDEHYLVPAPGLAAFAFPRKLRSAAWLHEPSAVPYIEEEDRVLKELSYWSASSATSSLNPSTDPNPTSASSSSSSSALLAASASADSAVTASNASVGGGMSLLDAAAKQAAEGAADDDDDDDSDSDSTSSSSSDDSEAAGQLTGVKRRRLRKGTQAQRSAKRKKKDDEDNSSSSESSDSSSSSSDSSDSDSSSSSSDDDDDDSDSGFRGKGKGKKPAKAKASAAKGKKGAASAAASAAGAAASSASAKGAAAGKGKGKGRGGGRETKAEKVKRGILQAMQAHIAQSSAAVAAAAGDEDSAIWAFGAEAANRFLRNDLVRKHAEACAAQLMPASSSSSSSSSSASSSAELGRVAAKALLALMYRSTASGEASSSLLLQEGASACPLNERSQSVSVSEIVRTLKEEYKEAPSSSSAGSAYGFAHGRMTPTAGIGAGSRSSSPSLSGINEKTVCQALQSLAKLPTAPVIEDRSASGSGSGRAGIGGSSANPGDRQFFVPYRSVITHLQLLAIEELIREKNALFGPQILRLLLHRGAMDEKQISDALMIPAKDARQGIFGLVSKGYIDVQEIPKRPDRHPQFTFYLYAASFPKLLRLMTEECHHAQLNLRRRRHMEIARATSAIVAFDAGTLALSPQVVHAAREKKLRDYLEQRQKARNDERRREMAAMGVTAVTEDVRKRYAAEDARAREQDARDFADDDSLSGLPAVHDSILLRMEEAAERLMIAAIRLETTTLLVRDLHYRSVPRLTGFDLEWIDSTVAKGGVAGAR